MPRLSDTHLLLLAHAAKDESGTLHPLPISLVTDGAPSPHAAKAIEQLIGRGLIVERETQSTAEICRTDGQIGFGQFITAIGLAAIGVDDTQIVDGVPKPAPSPDALRSTKINAVLTLLRRSEGATLAELIEATGWLPHTTRAALTSLRKKGHVLEKSKRGEITCYRVAA